MKARVVRASSLPPVDEQPRKYGIWCTERMQAALWHLAPGQRIVAHCHPGADSVLSVLSGSGSYFAYEDQEPDPAVCYVSRPDAVVVPPPPGESGSPRGSDMGPGAVAVTPAGTYYGLVNTGSAPLVALAVTAPDPVDSVYTVRMK